MKKIIGILSTFVFFATSASAATYKWVDDQGTLNFAEDPGNIPLKYRKKAAIIGDEEPAADMTAEKKESPGVGKAPEAAETRGPASVEKHEKKKTVYSGKDENTWKFEFARLKAEIKSVEEQLGSKRTLFSDPSKLSRTQYKSLQYDIKNLEQRSTDLLAELKSLQNEANRDGVPPELQQ